MMAFTFATNSSLVAWLSGLRVLSEVHPSRQGKETRGGEGGLQSGKRATGERTQVRSKKSWAFSEILSGRWCSGQILRKWYLFVFCDDGGIFVMLKGLQESSAFRDTCSCFHGWNDALTCRVCFKEQMAVLTYSLLMSDGFTQKKLSIESPRAQGPLLSHRFYLDEHVLPG